MKKLLALYTSLFSLMIYANGLAAEEEVKFSIGEWEPYTGEKIDNYGMASEIVAAACKAAGLKEVFEFSPWKRGEKTVLDGGSFATFPYKEIEERKNGYMFSTTLFSSNFAILIHKKNSKVSGFAYQKPEDLRPYSVGIVAGTDAIKIPLEKAGVKVEDVPTGDQNLKKLEAGRIDFYIDDKAVIYQALKKNYNAEQMAEFVFLESIFGEKNDFKIMVSLKYPDSKALLEKINGGIAKIAESGELKTILAKYGL